jgi:hypothetical protein
MLCMLIIVAGITAADGVVLLKVLVAYRGVAVWRTCSHAVCAGGVGVG